MPDFILSVAVVPAGNDSMGANCDIFQRPLSEVFACSLGKGDSIQVLHNAEEDYWYADFPVHNIWRYADGGVYVELSKVYIDPGPLMADRLGRIWNGDYYLRPWWSEQDGDLVAQLLASGWVKHG